MGMYTMRPGNHADDEMQLEFHEYKSVLLYLLRSSRHATIAQPADWFRWGVNRCAFG
jgi:hypothetical protein